MRPLWSISLVSLVACASNTASSSLGNAGRPPGPLAPLGPAPTVAWTGESPSQYGSFQLTGLPAVAADGSKVVIGWEHDDGGRGMPNLTLIELDRNDAKVTEQVVLDAEAAVNMTTAPDLTKANAHLETTNAAEHWQPLTTVEVIGNEEGLEATSWTATSGDVHVKFDQSAHLVIALAGKVVIDHVMSDWKAPEHPLYPDAPAEHTCRNGITLAEVYVDAARSIAVIRPGYRGNDSCWEPDAAYHVLVW